MKRARERERVVKESERQRGQSETREIDERVRVKRPESERMPEQKRE